MKTLSQHGPRFVKPGDRPLLLMTLIVPFHVLVSGPDSLFRAIFDEQGIPAWLGETKCRSTTAVRIDRLAGIKILMFSVFITITEKTWMR
ncbi:TPA: hypothetical protein IFD90_004946 [Escherichia coli]|nr:hypothetical protein [Escherichia coli]HAN4836253.1 hypothetical protein [Escherichia coli]HAU8089562.1 hypothetical protein [Escherichia coli]